jgi:hypothetical protein
MSHRGHPMKVPVHPAIFDGNVAALDEACFAQAASESSVRVVHPFRRRGGVNLPDRRHPRLLRAKRKICD